MRETSDTWYWEKTWSDFRRGTARAVLRWPGQEARVAIFDEGVPVTTAAILARLPIEIPVVHVAWSGDMVMSTRAFDIGVADQEHHVRLVRPGDLAFDPKFGEFTVTYGTAEARLPSGPNTLVVFGRIEDGLERFVAWARARRFEGLGTLTLARD
ncbi:DUF3830 family protein [Nitratireductor sp. ZSWI3]|uniref:DUF3830 family protein n=1 Tax=Nitratireductor sp. ZSWI3 TaxID=2966359 RepID=UPI0021504758|nr:DUF3830 family protein [Nitratireductor sp. ZSWI3]MCR4266649.1 DUF3830 family protein [Nitratireductor sp. ZSWI3]